MSNKPTDTTNYTKMEALKDILFGQEMGGLEERIAALEDKFDAYAQTQQQAATDLQNHFDKKISEAIANNKQTNTELAAQKTALEAQLKQIHAEVSQKITALDNTNATDLTAIGKALSELGAKLIKK